MLYLSVLDGSSFWLKGFAASYVAQVKQQSERNWEKGTECNRTESKKESVFFNRVRSLCFYASSIKQKRPFKVPVFHFLWLNSFFVWMTHRCPGGRPSISYKRVIYWMKTTKGKQQQIKQSTQTNHNADFQRVRRIPCCLDFYFSSILVALLLLAYHYIGCIEYPYQCLWYLEAIRVRPHQSTVSARFSVWPTLTLALHCCLFLQCLGKLVSLFSLISLTEELASSAQKKK